MFIVKVYSLPPHCFEKKVSIWSQVELPSFGNHYSDLRTTYLSYSDSVVFLANHLSIIGKWRIELNKKNFEVFAQFMLNGYHSRNLSTSFCHIHYSVRHMQSSLYQRGICRESSWVQASLSPFVPVCIDVCISTSKMGIQNINTYYQRMQRGEA